MQTRVQLFLTTPGIVRMFGIKSSMKRIVWWYFSWPACLVRSGKPWLCELGPDRFGSRLDLVTGPQHPLPLTMWTIMQGFPGPISFLFFCKYNLTALLWNDAHTELRAQKKTRIEQQQLILLYLHSKLTFIPTRAQVIFQKDFRNKLSK